MFKPMPFQPVRYTGKRLVNKYPEDIKGKIGEVVGYVDGCNAVVCDFGGRSYIIDPDNLVAHVFKEVDNGPEVTRIARKWSVDLNEGATK